MKLEIVHSARHIGLRYRVVNHIGQFLSEYDSYDAAMHYLNVRSGAIDCHKQYCICQRG